MAPINRRAQEHDEKLLREIAAREAQQPDAQEDEQRGPARQAVQAVGEVDGVGDPHDHDQRERQREQLGQATPRRAGSCPDKQMLSFP